MSTELTPAFITIVQPDHTISLPEDIPVGAKVMVVMVPANVNASEPDSERKARFENTLAAIKAATEKSLSDLPSDENLSALVDQARKASS
jgi:hypothetical protein